jgi:hypothetical protein
VEEVRLFPPKWRRRPTPRIIQASAARRIG